MLEPLGCRIVETDSGVGALRCLMEEDYAVILLDVRMPTMNGFETASLIRLRPRSEMTPIIFLTAHVGDEIAAERYAHGSFDFLNIPIVPEELRAKVSVFANLFLRAETLAVQSREVEASADKLRLLAESAPIGILQTDVHNRYVYSNPRWAEISGVPSAVAEGKEWDTIIDPDQRPWLAAERPDLPMDGTELSRRFTISGPGETSKIVLLTARAVHDGDGAPSGWVGTLADITAEADAEAALSEARDRATEASRLKSDFLANMSHEIRTPMNGVLGMTELLLGTDLDPGQRDYAQMVHSSGEALLTVINDILDFSKIETGKLEIEDVEFGVATVTNDVIGLLAGSAHGKGLELFAVVDSAPEIVNGDPGRLRQVLTNLIGNAIKFSDRGEIVVRVTAPGAAEAPSVIRFDISDTGVGIDPSKLASIFEPFVQEDTSTTRRYGGTGLGLAISAQLVALMGGEIGVSSELGAGSTFWFTIGTRTDHAEPTSVTGEQLEGVERGPAPDHSAVTSAPVGSRQGRLLVAEDNQVNRKVAVAMLTRAGYAVDTARNGLEAVQAALTHEYDAILMDCQMPELNGYEATAAIRAQEGLSRRTPIIALTAGARLEDRKRCLAQNMDDYLSKPFSKDALLKVVSESMRSAVIADRPQQDPIPTGS